MALPKKLDRVSHNTNFDLQPNLDFTSHTRAHKKKQIGEWNQRERERATGPERVLIAFTGERTNIIFLAPWRVQQLNNIDTDERASENSLGGQFPDKRISRGCSRRSLSISVCCLCHSAACLYFHLRAFAA
jgi:hypothetical protein